MPLININILRELLSKLNSRYEIYTDGSKSHNRVESDRDIKSAFRHKYKTTIKVLCKIVA